MGAPQRQQTIETVTTLYNEKLRLERRNANPTIHARTFLHGKTIGKSTGETTLGAATRVATDWYLEQLDRSRRGELHAPLFSQIAEKLSALWLRSRVPLPVGVTEDLSPRLVEPRHHRLRR